jgi:hypothetical protein
VDKISEVPRIHDSTLRDIPARLRALADKIEQGEYKHVETCAIVLVHGLEEPRIAVLGYGDRSEHDTVGLVLMAGASMAAGNYR